MNHGVVQITIDGPTASGKGSIAKAIASHFGFFYLDTGLLYRGMGFLALTQHSREELDQAGFWTESLVEVYRHRLTYQYAQGAAHLLVDGVDVTGKLRLPDIDWAASHVSSVPVVRAGMREMQKEIGSRQSVVIDGRDCGTVLFPLAAHKFFLTASFEVRVQRALADRNRRAGSMMPDEVRQAVIMRDLRDLSRPLSPLRPAPDAIILDTTGLGLEASTALVLSYIA